MREYCILNYIFCLQFNIFKVFCGQVISPTDFHGDDNIQWWIWYILIYDLYVSTWKQRHWVWVYPHSFLLGNIELLLSSTAKFLVLLTLLFSPLICLFNRDCYWAVILPSILVCEMLITQNLKPVWGHNGPNFCICVSSGVMGSSASRNFVCFLGI